MKVEDIRPSFSVYVVASDLVHWEGVVESLTMAGYAVAGFTELEAAVAEFPANPPHFLIFDSCEERFHLRKAIKQVILQLPESHVFVLTPVDERAKVVPLLEHGVYDLILTPLVAPVELTRALDRAAERDYFMYANERLALESDTKETLSEPEITMSGLSDPEPSLDASESIEPTPLPSVSSVSIGSSTTTDFRWRTEDLHLSYTRQLFSQKSVEECIQVFLRTSSEILGSCRTVFFRYIPNRRVLVAAQTQAFAGVDPGGVGVNFNETSPEFRSTDLRRPREVVEIGQMVEEIFHTADYIAYTVEALSEIQGVLLLLHAAPEASFSALLEEWVALLNKALSLLEAEKRMHVMAIKDAATDLLNRAHFITRLQQEISRARRTLLPVSLVMIAIDHYDQMIAKVGPEEAQVLLRMVARIFEKHSRVNDTIGRTGTDEFGIILPHTGKRGALIKAERLRRIVESADFSRVIRIFPHLTISLGVSEYPTMVRDAEELLQSADEALFQVRKNGNRTCVAKPPLEGFQPDFEVNEKGPS